MQFSLFGAPYDWFKSRKNQSDEAWFWVYDRAERKVWRSERLKHIFLNQISLWALFRIYIHPTRRQIRYERAGGSRVRFRDTAQDYLEALHRVLTIKIYE